MTRRRYPDLPPHVSDIRGKRYNRLVVIAFDRLEPTLTARTSFWKCRCDCGKEIVAKRADLNRKHTQSCGCYHRDVCRKRLTTHGKAHTKPHITWMAMRERCHNPSNGCYERYGGRGIYVCERWRDSFEAFYEDMGDPPSRNHSLERINNDGPYSPANCRWATRREQGQNKRNNIRLTLNGETLCAAEWARRLGMNRRTIEARYHKGWPDEKVLTLPLQKPGRCA